jgi:hypothetical protein
MLVHTCNSSTGEAEAEGSGVQDQPGLCHETLFKKTPIIRRNSWSQMDLNLRR